MSGMNALSGITLLGAVAAVGLSLIAVDSGGRLLGQLLGGIAIIAATVNVVGGFGVTHRMLKMFDKKKKKIMSSTVYIIICALLSVAVLLGISLMSRVKTAVAGNLISAFSVFFSYYSHITLQ